MLYMMICKTESRKAHVGCRTAGMQNIEIQKEPMVAVLSLTMMDSLRSWSQLCFWPFEEERKEIDKDPNNRRVPTVKESKSLLPVPSSPNVLYQVESSCQRGFPEQRYLTEVIAIDYHHHHQKYARTFIKL